MASNLDNDFDAAAFKILGELGMASPEGIASFLKLVRTADDTTLLAFFNRVKHEASAESGSDEPSGQALRETSQDSAAPQAAASAPPTAAQTPPPPAMDGPWDERGFYLGPKSPDRFPRPRTDLGTTGWSA
jgi:hypothetical protein